MIAKVLGLTLLALAAGGTRGFLELGSGKFRSDGPPRGAYVEGVLDGGRFVPAEGAAVKGHTPRKRPPGAEPGWLELESQRWHSDTEAVSPRRPYVHGYRTADGTFHPDEPPKITR